MIQKLSLILFILCNTFSISHSKWFITQKTSHNPEVDQFWYPTQFHTINFSSLQNSDSSSSISGNSISIYDLNHSNMLMKLIHEADKAGNSHKVSNFYERVVEEMIEKISLIHKQTTRSNDLTISFFNTSLSFALDNPFEFEIGGELREECISIWLVLLFFQNGSFFQFNFRKSCPLGHLIHVSSKRGFEYAFLISNHDFVVEEEGDNVLTLILYNIPDDHLLTNIQPTTSSLSSSSSHVIRIGSYNLWHTHPHQWMITDAARELSFTKKDGIFQDDEIEMVKRKSQWELYWDRLKRFSNEITSNQIDVILLHVRKYEKPTYF